MTALCRAVAENKLARALRLLEQKADPNASDNNGTTPLMNAAAWNNAKMVDLLISWGADAKLKDNFGVTASEYAKSQNHRKLARRLKALAEIRVL